jgi:hypothetical protein
MIKVIRFSLADLEWLQPREEEAALLKMPGFRDHLEVVVRTGGAFTAWLDGDVFAIYLHVILWPGCAEVGLLASKLATKKKKLFVKTTRIFLETFEKSFKGLQRIQATGVIDAAHDRLFKACGFTMECERMQKYLPNGADARLWARIKEVA